MSNNYTPQKRKHDSRRADRLEVIAIYGTALVVLILNWI